MGEAYHLAQDALRTRFGREIRLEAVHYFGQISLEQVDVGVQSHRCIAVAELLLDRLDVGSCCSHQGRARVAKVVRSDIGEILTGPVASSDQLREDEGTEVIATVGKEGVVAIIPGETLYIFEGPKDWRSVPVESVAEMLLFDDD